MVIFNKVIKSLGIVFGDIGTSPLYALSAVFLFVPVTVDNVIGVVSLVIWTLILLVSVQYAWLAMSVASKDEGGTIVLKESLISRLKSRFAISIASFLAFLGISFFIGDGVITPAISILSAVEGLSLIKGIPPLSRASILIIACLIAVALFLIQKRGTEKIGVAFGPFMLFWFILLGLSGFLALMQYPIMLHALNPLYGIRLITSHGFVGFLILSKIILCATGSEALYADMGHLGRRSIAQAWVLVFISLSLIYMGQGAFILQNPDTINVFYTMIQMQALLPYTLIVLLSIFATIIASQAMISGIFSIVYQAITTRILPRFGVDYTSSTKRSQIYIPSVNWFLMILVIIIMLKFESSLRITNAYGLAASGTMTITAILLTWIFFKKHDWIKTPISFVMIIINSFFFVACIQKVPYGGFWSLIIASIPFMSILIYTMGQKKLYKALRSIPLDDFVQKYTAFASHLTHTKGTAVFLSRTINTIPSYISHTMFTDSIMYEDNIIIVINTQEKAFGVRGEFKRHLAPGLQYFEISCGYKEMINIEDILMQANIYPRTIFYGSEDIFTKNIVWKIFALIKKLSPSFVQFYKLSIDKLHKVVVPVRM